MSNLGKILLADASKVVRVSLARELSGHFEVREESSGESAWQSLVLDHSIVAVVSGINLNRLDGLALVERLRESKLPRLNRLPFFLVVPDSFSDEERAKARNCGVNEFISRDSASASLESVVAALVERLSGSRHESADVDQTLVSTPVEVAEEVREDVGVRTDVGISDILGSMGGMAGLEAGDRMSGDSEGTEDVVLAREMLEERLGQLLTSAPDGWGIGILAFSLDGYDDLVRRYGVDLATRTVQKFSFLLARKIRSEDSIAQLSQGKVMIVAPATTRAICAGFANRICKAMTSAQISVRGQQVDLTVSVGIAVAPEDGAEISVQELLDLAESRLLVARRSGGNRVVADSSNLEPAQVSNEEFLAKLKELLGSTDPAHLNSCMGQVGLQLMPLLKQMDLSVRLGLPLDDINKRLWDRARAERMT